MPDGLTFSVPIRARSLNEMLGLHPMALASKKKSESLTVYYAAAAAKAHRFRACPALLVTITRRRGKGQREFDGDNLRGGLKHVRDEIAAVLDRDDGPGSGIEWRYRDERSDDGHSAVEITIEEVSAV